MHNVSFVFDFVAVLVTFLVGFIAYIQWKYSYWARVGLPCLKSKFPYGTTVDQTTGKLFYGEIAQQRYEKFKSNGYKHGGVYSFLSPVYIPVDPEIIKCILQKDFQHFVNHGGVYLDEENDPLSGHLFNLEDEKWRFMRMKLTPTFTSGKMKMMFQTMADCASGMTDILNDAAEKHTVLDIKDVLARFTTDIIASVAFGLECNSLKDPNIVFRTFGKKIFENDQTDRRKRMIQQALPPIILRLIKLKLTKQDVEDFFMKAIKDTVEYREQNNVSRKDFLQLLIQLKDTGSVADDHKIISERGLTMNEIAAQAFIFFLAGFETSSSTMTFALYEIASNPDIQDKLRAEIHTVLEKHGGEISYGAVMEMTYMEKVINETLRKYPPVPILVRRCTRDYTVPNTSILLEKGVRVTISTLGLHHDPDYYPNPEKFDPERFSEENKKTRPDFTWLPFGEGPRHCIGLRFGLLQSRVGIAAILRNHKIKLNQRTKVPIRFEKNALVSSVEGGVWLNIEKVS